jgi:hypothetical protein
MKLSTFFLPYFLATILLPGISLEAQTNKSDSTFYQATINNTIAFYQQSTHDQSRLNNGRKYKPYSIRFISGVPFFQTDNFSDGTITYEGGNYDNVNLMYDEVQDMVILRTDVAIELITERIEQFSIAGHLFVKLAKDSLNSHLAAGFYEQLYKGKLEIYKKEKKIIKENLSTTEGVRGEIETKVFYYLKKDGVYNLIKKKNNVYEVLRDKESEIQKFIKTNGLNFKIDPDNTLAKIAAYYDQLTN